MKYNKDKRTIGLNFPGDGIAEFCLWAPFARKIELLLNRGDLLGAEMVDDRGYWRLQTDKIKPGDLYQVKIDGDRLLPDPASLSQPEGVHGPSQALDPADFSWEDGHWKGLAEESIFYELHTGTFTGEGTFEGIRKKISYFKDLGINTIEIMPVAQFPGSRNWGYDGVFPFAVQDSYGGADGLRKLVNSCHLNGLAVVLDVVYNHLGPEGNYLNEFGPYFTDDYKTPWGSAVNFDGQWSDGVRHYYTENMLMWFRDFHIDGLRLDAVHAIKDFSARHFIRTLHENAGELGKHSGKKYLLIGEIDLNDTRYINPPGIGGYGLDKQWSDEFHHALHSLVTNEKNGYYADFGETWQMVKAFNNAYVFDGIWSYHRKRTFGSSTTGIPGNKFVVFTQNHDHIGNRMMGDRMGNLVSFEMLKLVAGAMFVSSFIPLIFMGEEYAEKNPFLYFTSHSDDELVELVSKGRKEEFRDFIRGEFPEPQSQDVFEKSKLTFDINGNNRLIFEYYRELIRLKKSHPVWKEYDRADITAKEAGAKVIFLSGRSNGNYFAALMNFGEKEFVFRFPGNEISGLHVLINSSAKRWGGAGSDLPALADNEITIPAASIIVLSDVS